MILEDIKQRQKTFYTFNDLIISSLGRGNEDEKNCNIYHNHDVVFFIYRYNLD